MYSGFLHFPSRSENHAEKLIEGWKGLKLIVRYRSNKPSESHVIVVEQPPRLTLS
jgi:hypothetical protein